MGNNEFTDQLDKLLETFDNSLPTIQNAELLLDYSIPLLHKFETEFGINHSYFIQYSTMTVSIALKLIIDSINNLILTLGDPNRDFYPHEIKIIDDAMERSYVLFTRMEKLRISEEFYQEVFLKNKSEFDIICNYVGFKPQSKALISENKTQINKSKDSVTQNQTDFSTENILLVFGIIIWGLMILFIDTADGTVWGGILYASFFLFAMWYTPAILIKKFFFK